MAVTLVTTDKDTDVDGMLPACISLYVFVCHHSRPWESHVVMRFTSNRQLLGYHKVFLGQHTCIPVVYFVIFKS